MSTFILMKILESAPSRYDRGIKMLTFGGVEKAYDNLVAPVKNGDTVLDIGCGTGALTMRAARKGARIKGIDINVDMLDIAKRRIHDAGFSGTVEFSEMGVGEMDTLKTASYDVIMSGLCFSELTNDELRFTLKEVKRLLKPGGYFLLADEVIPENILFRVLQWLIRFPLVIITYIFTQTTTHAVRNITLKIRGIGFQIQSKKLSFLKSFIELTARKPEER